MLLAQFPGCSRVCDCFIEDLLCSLTTLSTHVSAAKPYQFASRMLRRSSGIGGCLQTF